MVALGASRDRFIVGIFFKLIALYLGFWNVLGAVTDVIVCVKTSTIKEHVQGVLKGLWALQKSKVRCN